MPTDFDVVVVGGGAAGIAAAVGAAQSGATVCVIEQYGFLGGAATNSSVLTHCGFFDQTGTQVVAGVGQRVLDRLDERNLYRTQTMVDSGNTIVLLDQETTKSVYDRVLHEVGVTLLLHSRLIAATTDADRVTNVEIVHRGGRMRITGQAFVDCSGDGVLIAESGAEMVLSDAAERQACTLVMRAGDVAAEADLSQEGMAAAVEKYRAATGHGLVRDSGIAVRMPVTREIMLLLADQHTDVLDVAELTEAELRARELSWRYLDAFRRYLPGWENAYLASTGPQIGIREARRLNGRDAVRAADVSSGRRRDHDAIARCGWPMEKHVVPGVTEYGGIRDKGWYHIPHGAIRSNSTDNLWAGGRLVSSDNAAYASLRVMGTSFATGHACGVAAADYAHTGQHEYSAVRRELERQGALI